MSKPVRLTWPCLELLNEGAVDALLLAWTCYLDQR
jgi:hypothetical protein